MMTHTGEKPCRCNVWCEVLSVVYVCTLCYEYKPYQCSHCHVILKRTHIEKKPFECSHCDKTFLLSLVLLVNQKTHTGEKLIQCSHCDKSFSKNRILVIHQMNHTGENPFQCNHCNKAFLLVFLQMRENEDVYRTM